MDRNRQKYLAGIILPAIAALAAYLFFAYKYNFYQDDAYISFRYVANFLNGDGLVYNVGELVEGYTNFGWVLYLILWGLIGANYILVSKITGLLLGAGVIIIALFTARLVFSEHRVLLSTVVALLVGMNQSLAYWSPAGLETAAFAFCAVLAFYLFLQRSWLVIPALVYAVLLRPEGAVVTGILIVLDAVREKRLPAYMLASASVALLFCLPFVGFKLAYYGSILPNPFYAKTSFSLTHLSNGLEYAGRFFAHYGFYGVGFVVPILFWRKLSDSGRLVWLFGLMYVAYIVMVGGDVLKVHRFFLPVFGVAAMVAVMAIWLMVKSLSPRTVQMVVVLTAIPLLGLTYYLPRDFVQNYNITERAFISKMQFKALQLKDWDRSDFSVAVPTIGIFGYELVGHDIIDMLGLCDTTIARYSEEPIEGMQSTWKESKHNSRYLLERAPDYIVFSTDIKPSAPAEKALNLYPQFLQSYRTVAWYYHNKEVSPNGIMTSVFKKVRPIEGEILPTYPVEYVENYKLGLDAFVRGDHRTAVQFYNLALAKSPQPYNLNLLFQKGYSEMNLGREVEASRIYAAVLRQDSLVYEAHRELYLISLLSGDERGAELHRRWLVELVPWYVPRLDTIVNQAFSRNRQRMR